MEEYCNLNRNEEFIFSMNVRLPLRVTDFYTRNSSQNTLPLSTGNTTCSFYHPSHVEGKQWKCKQNGSSCEKELLVLILIAKINHSMSLISYELFSWVRFAFIFLFIDDFCSKIYLILQYKDQTKILFFIFNIFIQSNNIEDISDK